MLSYLKISRTMLLPMIITLPVAEDYGYNYEEIIDKFSEDYGFKISDLETEGETSRITTDRFQ